MTYEDVKAWYEKQYLKAGDPTAPFLQFDCDCVEWLITEVKQLKTKDTTECIWTEDEAYWQGQCGICWVFIDGTPEDNNMNFCPNCGKKIKISRGE